MNELKHVHDHVEEANREWMKKKIIRKDKAKKA